MKGRIVPLTFLTLYSFLLVPTEHRQIKVQRGQPPLYEDRDGYEVLSLVLDDLSDQWKDKSLAICPLTTSAKDAFKAECPKIPEEFQGASEDFDSKVGKARLKNEFSLKKNYRLVAPLHASSTTKEQADSKVKNQARAPYGTYYVAAVGFDAKRTHAVAFVEYFCGNLCGNSTFYFLRKSGSGWLEAKEVPKCGRIY